MRSSQKSAKQILSDMELHLRETVQPPRKLIEMGWRDFRMVDHPETSDAVTLACDAFLYLSINAEGNWNATLNVLAAIKAYLDGETGIEARTTELTRLAALLKETPVRQQEIRNWFDLVYR